jgi:hypothetical protein
MSHMTRSEVLASYGNLDVSELFVVDEPHAKRTAKQLWHTAHVKVTAIKRFSSGTQPSGAATSSIALLLLFLLILFLGLTLNLSVEMIIKLDPDAGTFISVSQYIFIIGRTILLGSGGGSVESADAPTKRMRLFTYLLITAANTGSTILWNQSVKIGGPSFFPIFLTICSGQIVLIMLAKLTLTGARYSAGEIFGAALMSVGMATVVTAKMRATAAVAAPVLVGKAAKKAARKAAEAAAAAAAEAGGSLGIAAGVLLFGCYVLGIQKVLQEQAFEKFGKGAVGEMVFYQHAFGLPLLLTEYKSVLGVLSRWSVMPWVAFGPVYLPQYAWMLLTYNIVCNAAATAALLRLVSLTNSLVASLGVTLYRFGAILVSSLILNAPPYPPPLMGIGCLLVPSGSLTYIMASRRATAAAEEPKKK